MGILLAQQNAIYLFHAYFWSGLANFSQRRVA